MENNTSERAKLAAARAFIKEGQYDVARAVLETIPQNEQAQSWLAKLPRAGTQKDSARLAAQQRAGIGRAWVLISLIAGILIGVGGGLLINSGKSDSDTPTPELPTSVSVGDLNVTPEITPFVEPTPEATPETTPEATVEDTPSLSPSPEATDATDWDLTPPETTETPDEDFEVVDVDSTPLPPPEFDVDAETLLFDSEMAGLTAFYDAVMFPDGFYDVTVVTEGRFSLDIEPLEGECTNASPSMLVLDVGEAAEGETTVLGSRGCVAQVIISDANLPWTLLFQRVPMALSVQDADTFTYTSETVGLRASIGPVEIASGMYSVTVTTTGFITINLQEVSGLCDANIFGLFNLLKGEGTDGVSTEILSDECVGMILVNNATAPWSLTFDRIATLDELGLE